MAGLRVNGVSSGSEVNLTSDPNPPNPIRAAIRRGGELLQAVVPAGAVLYSAGVTHIHDFGTRVLAGSPMEVTAVATALLAGAMGTATLRNVAVTRQQGRAMGELRDLQQRILADFGALRAAWNVQADQQRTQAAAMRQLARRNTQLARRCEELARENERLTQGGGQDDVVAFDDHLHIPRTR